MSLLAGRASPALPNVLSPYPPFFGALFAIGGGGGALGGWPLYGKFPSRLAILQKKNVDSNGVF